MSEENLTSRIRVQVMLNDLRKHDEYLLTLGKEALTDIASERLLKIAVLEKLVSEKSDDELTKVWAQVINEEE